MNIRMGSQVFHNVDVPLMWGTRAILQDPTGRISVIDLSGPTAKTEIVGDEPAPGVEFTPTADGFKILDKGHPLYAYSRSENLLTGLGLELPDCQIKEGEIRVGSNVFQSNIVSGFGVGIAVTKHGIAMGAPLPEGLAELVIGD